MLLVLFILCVSGHREVGCDGGDCRWIATTGGTLVRVSHEPCTCTGTLDLSAMELQRIPAEAFSGLSAVSTIYLQQNKLTSIPDTAFAGLTSLTGLHLSENELTAIPTSISQLTSLRTLNLYRNKLTRFSVRLDG